MKLPLLIAVSLLATGCATSSKLPMPSGTPVRINSAAETQALLEKSGVVLIGPRKDDPKIKAQIMREPRHMLARPPNPDDFDRIGAVLLKTTVTVTFPYSSTEFEPDGSELFSMMKLAASDRLINVQVRGRTDSEIATPMTTWYATERAESAKRRLIGMGVPAKSISINVMGAGDPVADNRTKSGRAENRRVEIQFFLRELS